MSLIVFLGGIVFTVLVGLMLLANRKYHVFWWHHILVAIAAALTAIGVVITFDLAVERAQGAWIVGLIFGAGAAIIAVPTVRSLLQNKRA
ncbi:MULTISPECIES: hypothetical protein [Dehalogenimonas]|uniref:hypothetical protein n=1 Tax=Dehalogenimonas TaxID=670486 RepID=UPI000731908E|nr:MULTISPECIES: hypothetical protein [Dehalogenimonas]